MNHTRTWATFIFHHQTATGYLNEGREKYQKYEMETMGITTAVADIEQIPEIVSGIPPDCVPAGLFYNNQMYILHFTKNKTAPTHYIQEPDQREGYNQITSNMTVMNEKLEQIENQNQSTVVQITSDGGICDLPGTFGTIIS
jgi:hypothetical protein